MKIEMYPDDDGLKEPVRSFEDTFSMWDMFYMEVFDVSVEAAQAHRKGKCEPTECTMCLYNARKEERNKLRFSS